jgi:hypothetical protein
MKLKSFGCSFIFGNELSDITTKSKKYSQLTWPAIIAQRQGLEYGCYARPGSGNLQILNNVLDQVAQHNGDVYMINWTFTNRWDYMYAGNNLWHSVLPWDTHNRAEFYYRHFQAEYTDKLNNLIWINCAVQALEAAGAKFCMTYMDSLLLDSRWNTGPGIAQLQQRIAPHLHLFDGANFVDWSQHNGYAVSSQYHHPLEQAHSAAADYLINHNLV